jgi:hypothetical protein
MNLHRHKECKRPTRNLFQGLALEDSITFKYIKPDDGVDFFSSFTCEGYYEGRDVTRYHNAVL